ncbi:MAG: hypothetical protein ACE5F1_04220 [Planctomycetota bacterium]
MLAAGQHLVFSGSRIPRIRVIGNTRISGILELRVPPPPSRPRDPLQGLPGHRGGPGGATQAEFNSLIEWTSLKVPWTCRQTSAGGGGGSYWSPGAGLHLGAAGKTAINAGRNSWELQELRNSKNTFGPDSTGGAAFPVYFTDAELSGLFKARKSSALFLIGGSGGGGAGADLLFTQPHLTWAAFRLKPTDLKWSPGGGGGGGGGAMQLQSGGLFTLEARAAILARGGDGLSVTWRNLPVHKGHSAGGGGSGGSVLIQTTLPPLISGEINVLGGAGGIAKENDPFLSTASLGGSGGAGYIRIEAEQKPDHGRFVGFKPAAHPQNAGFLRAADHDPRTAVTSKWYDTEALFRPVFMFYEVVARVDGRTRIFSDRDPWSQRAEEGQPVVFLMQSAAIDPATKQPLAEPAVWQEGKIQGLDLDPMLGNGFRFMILLDRTRTLSGFGKIEIESVKVFYRC